MMYIYLKKTLLNKKAVFLYILTYAVMLYNFIDVDESEIANFTVYDTAVGFWAGIGAVLAAYLFLEFILISYYDKSHVMVRFKDAETFRLSIIKSQIPLAIAFTVFLNIPSLILILFKSNVIQYGDIYIYMLLNMITQAAAFTASGMLASFLYFKTLNLKSSVVIPFIIYTILNLADLFIVDQYFHIASCFAISSNANGLVIFQVCRKTLIAALALYLINVSIKKKRDLYNFDE